MQRITLKQRMANVRELRYTFDIFIGFHSGEEFCEERCETICAERKESFGSEILRKVSSSFQCVATLFCFCMEHQAAHLPLFRSFKCISLFLLYVPSILYCFGKSEENFSTK